MPPSAAQSTTHPQDATPLAANLRGWLRRHSRRLPAAWRAAALVLLRLHRDPARPLLPSLYAPGPRGRPAQDPLGLLRALLLMWLLQDNRLPTWVQDRRAHPRLAQIAGFAPFHTPGLGTCAAGLDRLEDGPEPPSCLHRVRPSRHRAQAARRAAQAAAPRQAASGTARLTQDLLAATDQPRPSGGS